MKLLSSLKNILLSENDRRRQGGTVLFSKVVDKKLIQLKSTFHQRKERFGADTYDEIVDRYKEYLETRRSKFQVEPRLAVPDSMVENLFSKNVEKIYNSFKEESPSNNQIIFVHKRKNNEDEKKFDYIEILLKKDGNFFNIITSAFSNDGEFLKTKDEEKKTNRVTVEHSLKINYKIVYI